MWVSGCSDFSGSAQFSNSADRRGAPRSSHSRRVVTSWDSVTAARPRPAVRRPPGSTIFYTAVGASDANGVGSSAECLFLTPCPNGMGYVPVTVRALTAQGFTVNNLNLGHPDDRHRPAISRASAPQYGRTHRRQLDRQRDAVRADQRDGGDDLRRRQRDQHHHLGAGRRRRRQRSERATSTRRSRRSPPTTATLIAGIRARAGSPRIVLLNVPERRRPAVPGRRLARAAPGGAARRRRHDAGPRSTRSRRRRSRSSI